MNFHIFIDKQYSPGALELTWEKKNAQSWFLLEMIPWYLLRKKNKFPNIPFPAEVVRTHKRALFSSLANVLEKMEGINDAHLEG